MAEVRAALTRMPWRRALVLTGVLLAAVAAVYAGWSGMWRLVLAISEPDYVAAPFFSEARFRTLHPGMTQDEVRETLGYPLSRYGLPGVTTRWVYSTAPSRYAPGFRLFQVMFDDNTGRVSFTVDRWTKPAGKDFLLRYEWATQLQLEVGHLVLTGKDGAERDLSESARPWLVVSRPVATLPWGNPDTSYLAELGLFSMDDPSDSVADVEGIYCGTRPRLPEHLYYTSFVYWDGNVTALAPLETSDRASMRADREWLMRQVLGHSVRLPEEW